MPFIQLRERVETSVSSAFDRRRLNPTASSESTLR